MQTRLDVSGEMDTLPSFSETVLQTTAPSASLLPARGGWGRAGLPGLCPVLAPGEVWPSLCFTFLNSEPLRLQGQEDSPTSSPPRLELPVSFTHAYLQKTPSMAVFLFLFSSSLPSVGSWEGGGLRACGQPAALNQMTGLQLRSAFSQAGQSHMGGCLSPPRLACACSQRKGPTY